MISLREPVSVQIRRGETRLPGGVQIKGNSGFVSGQLLFGSLVPYRASIVTLRCTETVRPNTKMTVCAMSPLGPDCVKT